MFSLKLKKWILTACLAGSMAASVGGAVTASAAVVTDPLGTMSGISGVTFATQNGDVSEEGKDQEFSGKMFTTNKEHNAIGCPLESGYTIKTQYYGTTLTKDRLQVGQHLYSSSADKLVKVSKWVLSHPAAQCIHWGTQPYLKHIEQCCEKYYNETNPGWIGYCADCGEMIQYIYYYMDDATAKALDHIQMGYWYYYKCPKCDNLEQGSTTSHTCQEISYNQYYVQYNKNAAKVTGSMGDSTHMYNNATEYNGKALETVQTSLSKNKFQRPGYTFVGWNTKKDGTGTSFTDEQEILNLTDQDGVTIMLYAQWEKCETTLLIKADNGTAATSGATYNGKGQYSTTVDYLGQENVLKSLVTPGNGYKVTFDTNGGTITGMGQTGLKNVNGKTGYTTVSVRNASEWTQTFPSIFNSSYEENGSDAVFTNKATANGYTHILEVTYDYGSFTLPSASKDGQSFVGWELTTGSIGNKQFGAGEGITPSDTISTGGEITFKAKYAQLSMTATPDYETNNMKGAADLKWEWTQQLTNISAYKIYRDGSLININASGEESTMPSLGTIIDYSGSSNSFYTIQYSGVYEFTVKGNKGSDYNGYTGGSGGVVTGQVFLNKGDKLQYSASNPAYAGGRGTKSSGGGAAIILIKRAGTNSYVPLVVAGGGSGATDTSNGKNVPVSAETGASSSHIGGSGMYAGGGGWTGGASGEAVYHSHENSGCEKHEHNDGCYYSHKSTQSLIAI